MNKTTIQTVTQLAFMPRVFPVNCYLVEEDQELTLIDAAMPFSAKGIVEAAKSLHKPITRIVLTHAHSDHVGAIDTLKEMLPEAVVYISERDSRLLKMDRSLDAHEEQLPIKGGLNPIKTVPDVLLHDGDQIGSLLAVSTPGHTPGSFSYYDTRTGALLAGDAFQVRGGVAVTGHFRPLFPFPAMATWSKQQSLQSAEKLLELKPTLLGVGHGRLIEKPEQVMQRAINAAARAIMK
ncbi:MBL fold metallo-hydrolase [Paenibacillus sp. 1001270B_150601_E10]|uniref:MBL fold metallo-hydrolase n=1 Tax=Paenibacillus sp. 1001270B_150601_E10 TaxID=2787079 RepID=UPI00189D2462|nr:MBL fold metallo-hydrolase [Paenibacillus sp. 1001270B_150601_E10]